MAEKLEKPQEGLPQSARPEKTYKTSDPRPHHTELDGFRGIAILMTVITHTLGGWFTATSSLYLPLLGVNVVDLLLFGYLAVPMFFLLSGYLLTWTEEARRRRGSYSVLNYAKRRALRILPAYYVIIAVYVLVSIFIMPISDVPPSLGVVALHLTFLHGFVPSYPFGLDLAWWSLTPEIVFYAMLPLLILKFRKFSQRAMILTVLVTISLITRLLQAYDIFDLSSVNDILSINRMHFFPTTYLYLFLVGMLLRMIVERRTEAGHDPSRRQLFMASALSVVSVAVLILFPYLVMKQEELLHHPATMIPEAMIILLFTSMLFGSPVLKPLVRWRPLVLVGEISFSLFLLHVTVLTMVSHYAQHPLRSFGRSHSELVVWATFVAFTFVVLGLASMLAYVSYRYIESPFLRYKPK